MKKELAWPIGITLTLLIFVGFLVTAFILSRQVPINLVSEDYYQNEIQYQKQIDRLKRSRNVLHEVDWHYNPAQQQLTITIPHHVPGDSISGTITFYRPSDANLDVSFPLHLNGDGSQQVDVTALKKGFWRVYLLWKAKGGDYFAEDALNIR